MENREYLNSVVEKFNTNPNDPSLSEAEKVLLSKIISTERGWSDLAKQAAELEKEINQKTVELSDVRAKMLREKGRSDAFVESLLSLGNR